MPPLSLHNMINDSSVWVPDEQQFEQWIQAVLNDDHREIGIRIVSTEESQMLNKTYRQKDKPTNVLSFDYDEQDYLGDLVICAELVASEAKAQNKSIEAHWAHLTIHGVLHLLGYDHQTRDDAHRMEALESQYMKQFNFLDPWSEPV